MDPATNVPYGISFFSLLPDELIIEISSRMDYISLLNHINTDKRARTLCWKKSFWRNYLSSFSHHDFQLFILDVAEKYPNSTITLIKTIEVPHGAFVPLGTKVVDTLTLYNIWIKSLEMENKINTKKEILPTALTTLITVVNTVGKKRQEDLKCDKTWRYIFGDVMINGLCFLWKLPQYFVPSGTEQWKEVVTVLPPYDLENLSREYMGKYLYNNLSLEKISKLLIDLYDRSTAMTIYNALIEYLFGQDFSFSERHKALFDLKYFLKSNKLLTSYGEVCVRERTWQRNLEDDRLVLEAGLFHGRDPILYLKNPEYGTFPEEYFLLIEKDVGAAERKGLYEFMAPRFEKYGYTRARDLCIEKAL